MKPINITNAYYIKLGKNGLWEESSISESKLRIGWKHQEVSHINSGNWEHIREELEQELSDKGAVTRDLNALRIICESTSDDVWITFSRSRMWWCRVGSPVIGNDLVSKFRKLKGRWSDEDIHGNQLLINRLPGGLSKTQGFRGTVCRVGDIDALRRLLNNEPSPEYQEIEESRKLLNRSVEKGLRNLHWKDFETFVDLLFRASGWRRLSMLGENMKFADLELEDAITGDCYQVQIKSEATLSDFEKYSAEFDNEGYRKLYFVVHSPSSNLKRIKEHRPDVELILPNRLSEMAVNLGLVEWLMCHIK